MSFFYDTEQFRQGLIGLVHETVKDPGERDNLIALIGSYGDSCRKEGFEAMDIEFRAAVQRVREKYER